MTTSYNGIAFPDEWPPGHVDIGDDPLPVPYLSSPPAVIPVDVGRQLFVDDFLIESTTLKRVYHAAKVHDAAPVLSPETELELNHGQCPVAAPFNDGAWYDPADGTFKLFYQAGWYDGAAMATSDDGINWRRPELAAVPGTNAVIPRPPGHLRDGVMVWLDHDAAPEERFKMFVYWRWIGHSQGGKVYTSPDGIRWTERGMASPSGDNTTFFHNPFRRKFVFSIRHKWQQRARSYHEHDDFLRAARWRDDDPVRWARTDRLDRPDPLVGIAPQLYDLNAVAYESLMLGAFAIFHGPENARAAELGRPKINDCNWPTAATGSIGIDPTGKPLSALAAGGEAGTTAISMRRVVSAWWLATNCGSTTARFPVRAPFSSPVNLGTTPTTTPCTPADTRDSPPCAATASHPWKRTGRACW